MSTVMSSFKFRPPVLTDFDFKLNKSMNPDGNKTVPVSLTLQANVARSTSAPEATVELTVRINYDEDGNKREESPFWIIVTYASNFYWEESLSEDVLDGLLQTNAVSVLLSYIRPLVVQITSASPYPTYHIPFLNLAKMREQSIQTEQKG